MLIDKKRIIKIDVYSCENGLILSSYSFNVTEGDSHFGECFLLIKGKNIKEIEKGTAVEVVIYYINGDRVKYNTVVDVCTEYQINVTLGSNNTLLEERRRFYKLETDLTSKIVMMIRDEEDTVFEKPVIGRFKNINIGGVFLQSNFEFEIDDIIVLNFQMMGKEMSLLTKILRIQRNEQKIDGYGCCFLKLKNWQEEVLARYIHKKQTEQIDTIKKKIDSR